MEQLADEPFSRDIQNGAPYRQETTAVKATFAIGLAKPRLSAIAVASAPSVNAFWNEVAGAAT